MMNSAVFSFLLASGHEVCAYQNILFMTVHYPGSSNRDINAHVVQKETLGRGGGCDIVKLPAKDLKKKKKHFCMIHKLETKHLTNPVNQQQHGKEWYDLIG